MSPDMMKASTIYQTDSLGCPQGHLQPCLIPVHPQQVCQSTGKELFGGDSSSSLSPKVPAVCVQGNNAHR